MRRLATPLKYLTLVLACISTVLPISVIIMASLKTKAEFYSSKPFDAPHNWLNFANYTEAFSKGKMVQGFGNTAFMLVFSVAGTIIIGTMAAYALDRFEFRFKKGVFMLFLLATLVPGITTQVSTFRIINTLGLYNTRWAPIVLFMGTDIVSIYIFIQFMAGIPKELDEAATLDGCNHFTIYRKIILPLLKPAIATVVIVKGIAVYNEFYIPYLYMKDPDLGVMSTSLYRFAGSLSADWQVVAAGVIVVMIPTLIIFIALQRFIYNGFTQGSVK